MCADGQAFKFDERDLGKYHTKDSVYHHALSIINNGLAWTVGQQVKVSVWQVKNKGADHTQLCMETAPPQPDNSPVTQPEFSLERARPTTANAGPDLRARPRETVTLQGTGSYNPYGEPHERVHRWTQRTGPGVRLSDETRAICPSP